MLAYEAFIRRAAKINLPFMLKGSYVTRQYFQNPEQRLPNDLDWVYMNVLKEVEEAKTTFDAWATLVTETTENDGVIFNSFTMNAFWRMIDYAMADDFPTVNTDLICKVDGTKMDWFSMDVSFNLEILPPPIPLLYKPLRGESFTIPYTVPLALQVAWKLHQTLARPRFKDIFDLIHLLQHGDFNDLTLNQTLQALVNECSIEFVNVDNLKYMLDGNLQPLFKNIAVNKSWNYWRFGKDSSSINSYEKAEYITNVEDLPESLEEFIKPLSLALTKAGFTIETLQNLPKPKTNKHYKLNRK
jgi:hypothetical protein